MNSHSPGAWNELVRGDLAQCVPFTPLSLCNYIFMMHIVIGIHGDIAYLEILSVGEKSLSLGNILFLVVRIKKCPVAVAGTVFHLRNFFHGCL